MTSSAIMFSNEAIYKSASIAAISSLDVLYDWLSQFDCANLTIQIATESPSISMASVSRTTVPSSTHLPASAMGINIPTTTAVTIIPEETSLTPVTLAPSANVTTIIPETAMSPNNSDPFNFDCDQIVMLSLFNYDQSQNHADSGRLLSVTRFGQTTAFLSGPVYSYPPSPWTQVTSDLVCPDPQVRITDNYIEVNGAYLTTNSSSGYEGGPTYSGWAVCTSATDFFAYYRYDMGNCRRRFGHCAPDTFVSMIFGDEAAYMRLQANMTGLLLNTPDTLYTFLMNYCAPGNHPNSSIRPSIALPWLVTLLLFAVMS